MTLRPPRPTLLFLCSLSRAWSLAASCDATSDQFVRALVSGVSSVHGMTVSYSGDVGNASVFGCFNKILARWRGSVYKLVFKELLAYIQDIKIIKRNFRFTKHRSA